MIDIKRRVPTILKMCTLLFLVLSLLVNYAFIRANKNSHINGGSDASFYSYGNEDTLTFDGCLLWEQEKHRSNDMHQYWKVRVRKTQRDATCSLINATEMGESVIISEPEECELVGFSLEGKTASIIYKDATITVNRDRIIWTTSNPDEKGGGELVNCTDKRINWYPFE